MKRIRPSVFHLESMAELAGQLLRAPHDHQVQHLARAEKLHDEMLPDPDNAYPLAYVLFRITGVKAMYASEETLFGRGIAHDLREIISQLSKGLKQVMKPEDGCLDTQELARQKNIATRTIARWREDGLRWRWGYLKEGSYFQVVFPAAAVAAYEKTHAEKVAYAARFSQLSAKELRALFRRAKRLAEATGAEPFTIARHLARRTGRSTEALRLILVNHDLAEKPEDRIFSDYTAMLSEEQRSDIYRAWRTRVRTGELTRRFKRTRATIYRVVNEKRIETVASTARKWHPLPTLAREDAAQVFLSAPLTEFLPGDAAEGPADLPEQLRPFFASHPLTGEAAGRLLLRLNYLHYRLGQEITATQGRHPRVREAESVEAAGRQAQACRALIVRACLPLVHSMANRHLGSRLSGPLREAALLRLLSLSLPVLDEGMDAFDPGGNTPFDRYLTNRLLQRYAQLKSDPGTSTLSVEDLQAQVRSQLERLTQAAVV